MDAREVTAIATQDRVDTTAGGRTVGWDYGMVRAADAGRRIWVRWNGAQRRNAAEADVIAATAEIFCGNDGVCIGKCGRHFRSGAVFGSDAGRKFRNNRAWVLAEPRGDIGSVRV